MGNGYDIIIIGGGHAGAEAAAASAKRGAKVLLLSLSLDALGFMPCNPNVGGSAKGHLVTEIEALGGIMGKAADKASLQVKVLNKVNGAAVHSLRMQTDKNLYHRTIKSVLENTENLTILQTEAVEILVKEESGVKIVCGVKTRHGAIYSCRAAVICCGVYLNSRTLTGETIVESGPNGFLRSEILTKSLLSLGLPLRRFKTGTPPRLKGNSIDYTKCEIQTGDADESGYSYECPPRNDVPCYLTYTNSDTHNIILSNLDRAPLYNGSIAGVGPRYCPSIEDKVVRFKDKARHQLFIEPEGADTDEVYLSGFSTSLPSDIQNECVKTIAGLENAHITRYGYAIEYDCLDPRALYPSLAVKGYGGLYSAGQLNGSSGYEEAAAQGLIAGINASLYCENKPPLILSRKDAYIGVLIDDLTTKGTNEPYRMMTARAEYRLSLRQDNADFRLTEKGRTLGLVGGVQYENFLQKKAEVERLFEYLKTSYPKLQTNLRKLLARPEFTLEALSTEYPILNAFSSGAKKFVETEIKYEGYIKNENKALQEFEELEKFALSPETDYMKIDGLRLEARQKLNAVKPLTLRQAQSISGVNPADITILMLYLSRL